MNIENQLIFVVDDDPFQHQIMDHIISKNVPNQIIHFNDGADCLKKLNLNPCLIFLDCQMKSLSGLKTLQMIKKHNPNISVVIISGQPDDMLSKVLREEGALDYIKKDNQMYSKIDLVLEKIKNNSNVKK